MPMLFSLGEHQALVAIQARLQDDEELFAYLDDMYIVCTPARVHTIVKEELWAHARIVHQGKTQVWNSGGSRPTGVDAMTRAAQEVTLGATVWRGDLELPADRRCIFSCTPEPHIAFCPIFVHTFPVLEPPIQKWVIFVRRRPCVCDTFRFESPPLRGKKIEFGTDSLLLPRADYDN